MAAHQPLVPERGGETVVEKLQGPDGRWRVPVIDHARILILATDGFGKTQLFRPRERLKDLGADVRIASADRTPICAGDERERPLRITPDLTFDQVEPEKFDALLIPGGADNPRALCREPRAVAIVRGFAEAGKPIAASCEGSQLLAEAELIDPAAQCAETIWCDGNLLTSRSAKDTGAFTDALIDMISGR